MSSSKDSIVHVDAVAVAPTVSSGDKAYDPEGSSIADSEPDVNPLRRSFLKLYGCLFVAYLCSATNGFDANTFGE